MMGTNLLSVGEYEPRMIAVLQKYLKPGGVFIDLGANEGYFSVIASGLVGAGGRVIAVEPQSRLQPVIQENLRLNNCANVEIQHILLSATDGESELVLTPQLNTGASSIAPLHMKLRRIMPTEHVASLTLASFLAQAAIPRCDLIKIDIEGAEWDVLMNAGETLRSGILRNIALEIHNSILAARGINGMEIHPFILGCGYTLDDSLGHWVYTKTN
jgi:FkbM family methyltransferase